jgi:transcriptional regulator with XRE-family HTH domain
MCYNNFMPKLIFDKTKQFITDSSNGLTVGKRIAQFRKNKGLTQKELADAIGIDRSVLANYELGRVRVYDEVLARICIVLKVPADSILGIDNKVNGITEKNEKPSLKIMKRVSKIEKLPLAYQKIILRNIDLYIAGLEKELVEK